MQSNVVVTAGARTAIAEFGGSFRHLPPADLGAHVVRNVLGRSSVAGTEVDHVVFGNVHQSGPEDLYLARVAALRGGIGHQAPALTVNRLCASGLQAIISAAQYIQLGQASIAVAGGAENMSLTPHMLAAARFGQRMGDAPLVDMLLGGLTDPFHSMHMGALAEHLASQYGIAREAQDRLALESHRRAAQAIDGGYFRAQICPVPIALRGGEVLIDTDEHVRRDLTPDALARMKPAFQRDGGTVTPGNASGLNDAAAAVVLMAHDTAQARNAPVLGRLVAYAHTGVEPKLMGLGPVSATRKALQYAGLTLADLDVIESNEAFAAQALAVIQALELDPDRVNPNGSGISLGHPVGATGTIMVVKALYELQRTGGRYALVTTCVGGGQGIAAIFARD
jgi:acetyl-CoA C-acetyltransferase